MSAYERSRQTGSFTGPAGLSRRMSHHPGKQMPYGSILHPPSNCRGVLPGRHRPYGSSLHPASRFCEEPGRQRPYGSRLQPAFSQRLRRVLQARFQRLPGVATEVAATRGEATDGCAPASGSETARTRQSASEPMSRRVGLDIEISFQGGGSAAAGMARRAPVSQEYGLP